jgi:hypothetical protein
MRGLSALKPHLQGGIAFAKGVPFPAWFIWLLAVALSLGWGIIVLGIALSETSSTWLLVLVFGRFPPLANTGSLDPRGEGPCSLRPLRIGNPGIHLRTLSLAAGVRDRLPTTSRILCSSLTERSLCTLHLKTQRQNYMVVVGQIERCQHSSGA